MKNKTTQQQKTIESHGLTPSLVTPPFTRLPLGSPEIRPWQNPENHHVGKLLVENKSNVARRSRWGDYFWKRSSVIENY
jgi:hypothetical protein